MTMNQLTHPKLLIIAMSAIALVSSGDAFAQTTPYPQQQQTRTAGPSKTAPRQTQSAPTTFSKTQTAKTQTTTTQSKSHQTGKQYGHGQGRGGGVGFGVGASIDLSGIGQRRPEPNPFAVQTPPQPVATRTVEKPPPTKQPREATKTDPFAGLQLTGPKAKEEAASNRAAMDQAAETNPFASVNLTTEAKDVDKEERKNNEKQQ